MSRVDDLIQALCPDGVRYCRLGDVSTFQRGKQLKESDRIAGPYPVVTAGRVEDARHAEWNHPGPSITVTSHGAYAGHVNFWEGPIWLANNVFLLQADDQLGPRYFFYVLKSLEGRLHAAAKGGGVPYINVRDIESVRIPVPPLEVQREIVGVLDTFTQLEAELEAELEARRTQYEHYRDEYLREASVNAEWAPLGDVAAVRVGQRPRNDVLSDQAPYPYVNAGTTASGQAVASNTPGDTVTIPSRGQGGVGIPGYQDREFWCGPLCYRVRSHRDDLHTRFLYYYLKTIQPYLRNLQNTGGTPALNRKELVLVQVPIPPREEQGRILDHLTRWDTLVNDLTSGLPAEIEARRKQYEYYRDRLLTFEEVPA